MGTVARLRTVRVPGARAVAVGLLGVVLVGCSGSSPDSATPSSAQTTATTAADGTTTPGTVLRLGQRAHIRWHAGRGRVSLVDVSVTAVERGSLRDLRQFSLPRSAMSSSVYYVRATVRNRAATDLAGAHLSLFGLVSDSLVVPSVRLTSPYGRCSNPPLPPRFTQGAAAHDCLVILAPHHGRISHIQWRSDGAEPISWSVR
jgi:hypothetical protein